MIGAFRPLLRRSHDQASLVGHLKEPYIIELMCSEHLFLRLHIDHELVSACRQPQDSYAIDVDALANVKTIRGVVHQNTTLFTPVLG